MNRLLYAAAWLYQRAWCHCVSESSCCRTAMLATRLLSFRAALRTCVIGYGECHESTFNGTHPTLRSIP